jgi:hypothetical protein
MNPRNEATFQAGELRRLIDHEKLELTRWSPLAFALGSKPDGNIKSLLDRGLASDDWKTALQSLARPICQVRVLTPGIRSSRIARFYKGANGEKNQMIGCWFDGDGLRISFPWSPHDVAEAAKPVLDTDLPIPADSVFAALTPAGLFVLAAAMDAIRASQLSAMLERRPPPELRLDDADLQHQLALGFSEDDPRWSVSLLRLIGPPGLPLGADPLIAGLRDLSAADLVKHVDGRWVPTEALKRIAAHWSPTLPALAHEAVTLDAGGEVLEYRHCVAVRGDGPLWLVEFEALASHQPRVSLRSVDGATYLAFLRELINPPMNADVIVRPELVGAVEGKFRKAADRDRIAPSGAAKGAGAAPTDRVSGAATIKTAGVHRFCGGCGAAVQPGWKFCRECGEALKTAAQAAGG